MKPSVSIIIPTYNAEKHIKKCLRSVLSQDYAFDLVEIIIADNCSTDNTLSVIKNMQANIKVVKEFNYPGSPYSTRNRGIEQSSGEIIFLLDSDCIPANDWLTHGVNALLNTPADLAGGKVIFSFNNELSIAEMYDSLMNIKMKESIEKYRCAKTANLFIRRKVFDTIGLFPEGFRSGFDVIWTRRATDRGFKLIYCDDAIVHKPARGFTSLLKKQWRVARAQPVIWTETKDIKSMLIALIKIAIPPATIRKSIKEYGQPYMQDYIMRLFFFSIMVRIIMIGGNIYGLATIGFQMVKSAFRISR